MKDIYKLLSLGNLISIFLRLSVASNFLSKGMLAPFKLLHLHDGVNVTAGLPIIRTSPDHGTGYDIVMRGVANEQALLGSIYMAIDLYRNRQLDEDARSNVLPKLYKNKRGDNE